MLILRRVHGVRYPFCTNFNPKTNYYDILDLPLTATDEQIKQSFREKAKKYHPDVDPAFEQKFKLINEAHQILSDPALRSKYLRMRQAVQAQPEATVGQVAQVARDPVLNWIKTVLRVRRVKKKERSGLPVFGDLQKWYKDRSEVRKMEEKVDKYADRLSMAFLSGVSLASISIIAEIFLSINSPQTPPPP